MFKFPFTNFHELNLDWILSVVKEAKEVFDSGREDIDYAVSTANDAKTIAQQAASGIIGDESITEAKLADNAVTTAKLHDSAVTAAKIDNGAVTTAKLYDSAVTTPKIANGAITPGKLSEEVINLFSNVSDTNYCKMPDGTLIQWGFASYSESIPAGDVVQVTVNYPLTFINTNIAIFVSVLTNHPSYRYATPVGRARDTVNISIKNAYTAAVENTNLVWAAVGRWK